MLFVVSSLLSGLALYFVALSVAPELGISDLMFVLAASNLASAVSMVAVFAPAGVGVREAIQIAALLFVMSPEQAVAATLLMRLLSNRVGRAVPGDPQEALKLGNKLQHFWMSRPYFFNCQLHAQSL